MEQRSGRAAVVASVLALCVACGDVRGDKAGNETATLRLATIDAVDNNGQSFGPAELVRALEDVSGGKLRVEVDTQRFGDGSVTAEAELVKAIAAGRVDGGWPSTRAFSAAGIDGLEVVEAPFTLTSYDSVRELVESETSSLLLGRLEGTGLVGLGLAVGPLRRPFAADGPLLEPLDWAGAGIRSFNSPVQAATIRSLGAEPVQAGESWPDLLRSGTLRGVEFDVAQYYENGMTDQAGHLASNVVLWPKVFVLSLSQERWDSLDDQQRSWVSEAAERAVTASVEADYDEDELVQRLCAGGSLTLHEASTAQLSALRDAVRTVIDPLTEDPAWPGIRDIADRHPDPESLDPASCRPAARVRTTDSIQVPREPTDFPDGVYRIEVRQEDLDASRIGPATDGVTGLWTMTTREGRFSMDCAPLEESTGIDCNYTEQLGPGFDSNPREVGAVYGTGGTVFLVHETRTEKRLTDCTLPASETGQTSCLPQYVHRIDWQLGGDQLTMNDMLSESPSYQLVIGPWTKIG